jgi:hypothetical protein
MATQPQWVQGEVCDTDREPPTGAEVEKTLTELLIALLREQEEHSPERKDCA